MSGDGDWHVFSLDIDNDTGDTAEAVVAQMAKELGESPEAWRGARVFGDFIGGWGSAMIKALAEIGGLASMSKPDVLVLLVAYLLDNSEFAPPSGGTSSSDTVN